MEIQRLISVSEPIRNAGVVLYSLFAMVSIVPGFSFIGILLIPYYFIVPGVCVTLLLRQAKSLLDGAFFSVSWSVALMATVSSVNSLGYARLPINLVIPILTVLILTLVHYRK